MTHDLSFFGREAINGSAETFSKELGERPSFFVWAIGHRDMGN
jgi:hypothetical protein